MPTAATPTYREASDVDASRVDRDLVRIAAAEAEVAHARRKLEDTLAELHDDGLSYRVLGELAGVTKQYAGDLVIRARNRRQEEDAA